MDPRQKNFFAEYRQLINHGYIIRMKKKTGKGSDWHISLNPRKVNEILEMIE